MKISSNVSSSQLKNVFDDIRTLALFGDIHFGCRNNSEQHNLDCLEFIDWFIQRVRERKATHIAFLGDFFEHRAAINVRTLDLAAEACRRLNAIGIPVIFIVGNHDLFHRQDRSVFSTGIFRDLQNFVLISEPTRLAPDWFAVPYLFRDEYPGLVADLNSSKYVLGHFEFRNFVITGTGRLMEHGPDAGDFAGPRYIFSGHFHKRQVAGNVVYIGNPFPTNFGDAGDADRGCAFFDVQRDDVTFQNWDRAPLFFKTRLSRVIGGDAEFPPRSRVRCLLDMDVGYSDVQALRDEMVVGQGLREFSVEEDPVARKELISEGLELEGDLDLSSLDNTVRQLITEGVSPSPTIDPQALIELYEEL